MPIFAIDKPLQLTSHDVVAHARRVLGTRKVGHGGTLDPLATGVLVLLSGEETKLSPYLSGAAKEYLAWVSFGAGTPTLDAEGPITETADPAGLDAPTVERVAREFLGVTMQEPPQFSAVKTGGEKGYQAARAGRQLELPARPVGYRRIELLGFASDRDALPGSFTRDDDGVWRASDAAHAYVPPLPETLGTFPTALLHLEVAAGTYIRSFARDLGARLGVPAHLSGLLRTRAGRVGLEDAVPVESLGEGPAIDPARALQLPQLVLSDEEARRVRLGQRLAHVLDGPTMLIDGNGRLVALAETREGRMKLLRVFLEHE